MDGRLLPLGPTAGKLLFYLASNRDRVVTSEELMREVWEGVRVTPSAIQQVVRSLRVALAGEDPRIEVVRTIRGRGYQLGADVEVADDEFFEGELPLSGRTASLNRLLEAVESARASRGRVVLLSGPPGTGKTRLLQEIGRHAPRRGFRIHWGRCPEQSPSVAFSPWEEILRSIRDEEPQAFESITSPEQAALDSVFPDLAGRSGPVDALDAGSARERLHRAVRQVLVACSRVRPIVLAIDDLHRADATSVALLEWLAARSTGEAIVFVATYRDRVMAADPLARAGIARLQSLPGCVTERLADLTRADVEALVRFALGDGVSTEDVEQLWRRSGGNPLFLKLLLDHLRHGRKAGRAATLPPEAYEAIRQHVGELSPRARHLLLHAAILGREIETSWLAEYAGVPPAEVSEGLREARAARLVEMGPLGSLRFVHALVPEALYDGLEPASRISMHASAVEVLEPRAAEREELWATVAEHAWRAASAVGTGRAAAACEHAARTARRRFAFEEAARLLERTLDLSSDAEAARRLDLLLALGESHVFAGRAEAANEVLGRAIELAKHTGDAERHARAVLTLAILRGDEGQAGEADWVRILEEAVESYLEETSLRARLLSRLAAAVWRLPPAGRARELAERSVRLARETGDADALATALVRAFRILQTGPGDERAREEMSRELAPAVERAADPLLAANARITLLWQALLVGDRPAFDEQVTRIEQLAESVRAPQVEWFALVARASNALLAGQLDAAEDLAGRSLAVGEACGVRVARAHHVLRMFAIRWAQGRLGESEGDLAEFADVSIYPWSWKAARRLAGLAAGHDGPARELLHRFCADPDSVPRDVVYGDVLHVLAEIAVQLADERAAALLVHRLEELRGRHYVSGGGYCHISAHERALGGLLGLLGRWDDAERALAQALARERSLGALPAVARSQRELAGVLAKRGRPGDGERSRALLEEAAALARAIGNTRLEGDCTERLREN